MKIESKTGEKYMKFDELSVGDVFVFEGEVYIKTNSETFRDNALHLASGELEGIIGIDTVRFVNATLTIE